MSIRAVSSIMSLINDYLLVCIGAPNCLVFEIVKSLIFGHFVQEFNFNFFVRMSKRTIFVVLADLSIDKTLAVFGFVAIRVIQLLYFIVSK